MGWRLFATEKGNLNVSKARIILPGSPVLFSKAGPPAVKLYRCRFMTTISRQVKVIRDVDRQLFERDILPAGEPVLMKGLVSSWPAVQAAQPSNLAVANYLKRFDQGKRGLVTVAPPEMKGRYFFNAEMTAFNFFTDTQTVSGILDWLLQQGKLKDAPTAYMPSVLIHEFLPGLATEMTLPVKPELAPRIWIGGETEIQTHFDPSYNIACVVAGKRRFTVFPPEQVHNLYPGPFDVTPGGVPFSMASLYDPDFDKYPRFRDALSVAQYADLEPGDALFVPYMWWHHVQSYGAFNVLVNYWWSEGRVDMVTPYLGFYTALLAMRDLPAQDKAVWRNLLDLFVFGDHEKAVEHLPSHARSALGPITPQIEQKIKAYIKTTLKI